MSKKRRPLPVPMDEDMHEYLKSKKVSKAEYVRRLILIDMAGGENILSKGVDMEVVSGGEGGAGGAGSAVGARGIFQGGIGEKIGTVVTTKEYHGPHGVMRLTTRESN